MNSKLYRIKATILINNGNVAATNSLTVRYGHETVVEALELLLDMNSSRVTTDTSPLLSYAWTAVVAVMNAAHNMGRMRLKREAARVIVEFGKSPLMNPLILEDASHTLKTAPSPRA